MYTLLEDALARTERHLDYVDAALDSVRAQQAHEAVVRESATDWHTPSTPVREVAGPEQGRRWGDALLGRTLPVREADPVDSLGNVISAAAGAHSHGSVRHSHDRLRGPHLHCMHCGGDSRLCLDAPHHAEGPTAVRESASAGRGWDEGRALGDAIFDRDPSRPPRTLSHEEHAALGTHIEAVERAARAKQPALGRQATAQDKRLVDAFERACGGNRP